MEGSQDAVSEQLTDEVRKATGRDDRRAYELLGTYANRQDAASDLWKLRAVGEHKADLADVRVMTDPPRTVNRWALIRWKR